MTQFPILAMLSAVGLAWQGPQSDITPDMVQTGSDIAVDWHRPEASFDYVRRDVMIAMRDGVRLHTVIVIPKGARGLPILLERTPYDSDTFVGGNSPHMLDIGLSMSRQWVADGYILVFQDLRGKYGSEGNFVMQRPPIGPLNPSNTDDTTDAYDTIEWLVNHLPESNQRVGMIGSSYDGWAVTMALLNPHPALKVAAPESPMIDGWMGDDWFHYGAFRQINIDFFIRETSVKRAGRNAPRWQNDDYQTFLEAGSAGEFADTNGLKQLPFWNRLAAHPAYDAFWRGQALGKALAAHPSRVPTLWLQGLWDQEDIYGAIHAWQALKQAGFKANNYLVIGPWRHSQVTGTAETLGPLHWRGDTAADFRKNVLVPFFDTYLKDRKTTPMAPVQIYNASKNDWDRFDDWPTVDSSNLTPLYFHGNFGLGFDKPTVTGGAAEDRYVSDPAKPVPFIPQPVDFHDRARWSTWLVQDQRFVSSRPDVLSYQTAILTEAVRLQGAPVAKIFAKTTGSDGDFVVKVIDVYPGDLPEHPEMAGYQLPISLDIFRGRYRKSFELPSPIPIGRVQEYRFALPPVDYVFEPGHRIMVQIQSTLFPLYDRNPQTYVANIFFTKPSNYKRAEITLERGAADASAVLLPIVAASAAIKSSP
jgi:uncharacterized protein